ncbi:Npt1/Npt2 family nucleotide transporter [Winogradskyella maritima]|uniref:ADP,ATP carrier protein n=1 Tax=Winogradskyella maritima TaxID=1517766 RepID=A0ABV8ACR0_9FLAO|nr:Npt1/Npt2 family nucleotide transporter [Winogradskyella maritima]
MQLYIFLVITVLLIVKPIVNALFLSELGASHLPYGYILVAIIAVITTYYYNKGIKRFSLLKVTSISLISFALFFLALAFIILRGFLNDWMLYVYYVGISLFAVIATSQFWILANLVFDSREAKRLFGFIGAGAIAGGVFGGYLTSVIVSAFGNISAIVLAAVLISLCVPIMHKIWKLRIRKLNIYIRKQRKFNDESGSEPALKIISKSKHLTYLALIIGLSVIVAKLVDFQFSDFANRAILNSDDLASFFGFWFSTFNVIALCLQLFATNRVLSKLGVASTLLVLPLGIALGSLLFLTFPELWVLIIIKGIDGSFKQSLNKAAVELSIMPIPFQIKNQAKSFIDVAVDSIATGLAGLLLILLVRKLDLSTGYITTIILALSFIWIILIYKLREAYFNSFRINIQRTLTSEAIEGKPKRENTIAQVRRILNSGDEEAILSVLKQLSSYRIKALKPEIIRLLNSPSDRVKAEVIEDLYSYDKGTAIEQVKTLIHSDDEKLSHTALTYILEHSNVSSSDFFSAYLNHKNDTIASSALLCLGKETVRNEKLRKRYGLDERIERRIKTLRDLGNEASGPDIAKLLMTIAYSKRVQFYPFIDQHFGHGDSYVVKHAIKAAGITQDIHYREKLLHFLSQKQFRKPAIKALKNYGSEITKTILKLELSESLNNTEKRHIPKLIESFHSKQSIKVLMRLLRSKDVIIRLEASKSLMKLKSKYESLQINKRRIKTLIIRECKYANDTIDAIASFKQILVIYPDDLKSENATSELDVARQSVVYILEEQLEQSFECVFKLLSLMYDEADINVSYSGIMSDVQEAKINALEFLDNLLQSQIRTEILPIVEYYTVDRDDLESAPLSPKILPENKLIAMLVVRRGKRMKLEMLRLIKIHNDKSYATLVRRLLKHKNPEIVTLARETMQQFYA